jgi:hypothetical protein
LDDPPVRGVRAAVSSRTVNHYELLVRVVVEIPHREYDGADVVSTRIDIGERR